MATGIRRRSSRMHRVGKMRSAGGALMEPRGNAGSAGLKAGGELKAGGRGIRGGSVGLKAGGRGIRGGSVGLKAGGRGIRGRNGAASLGQVVKAGNADEIDKATSAGSAGEGWIYVRGHLIEKAGLRLHIDPDGNVYVPDSEDEESDMGDQACGRHVSAGTDLAMDLSPKVHDDAAFGAVGVEMAPDVAEDQAAHKDLPVQERLLLADDEDSRMKVPTEVPEQLKEVLANIDPFYHDVFVSMYKIMVPICFR